MKLNHFKKLAAAVAMVGLIGGQAYAASLLDNQVDTDYDPYYIAYEIYDNTLGINADQVPVYIELGAAVSGANTGTENKNLRVQGGKVNAGSSGNGVVLLLAEGSEIDFYDDNATPTDPTDDVAYDGVLDCGLTGGTIYSIGSSPAISTPAAEVTIGIFGPASFEIANDFDLGPGVAVVGCDISDAVGGKIWLRVSPVIALNGEIRAGVGERDQSTGIITIVQEDSLNFNVNENLDPSCTTNPTVKLAYIAQSETAPYTTILEVRPQFTLGTINRDGLSAELNTDTDFKTFIPDSGINVLDGTDADAIENDAIAAEISNTSTVFLQIINNNVVPAINAGRYKAFVQESSTATLSFSLNSVSAEAGLTVDYADINGSCTSNIGQTAWSCTATDTISDLLSMGYAVTIQKNTTVESNPTVWTISNSSLTIVGSTVAQACVDPTGSIGVWFGGLEVLVPFVKGDPAAGYETYIVLYNRYSKDAKIYVKPYKDDSAPILVSTSQIAGKEVIPTNGRLVLTHDDIATLMPAGYNMADGIPVKFLVRVPSQQGTTTYSGSLTPGMEFLTETGTISHTNPYDPYIEGIVVSVYPGGGQRNIPLKFKTFKNGEFGH